MQQAITDLLRIGAIKRCASCSGQFLSDHFLVLKSNGKMRFVLNLKLLNTFLETEHFKMEDIRTASTLLFHSAYMATLDLQDAYFLVPVHRKSRKFLRFI